MTNSAFASMLSPGRFYLSVGRKMLHDLSYRDLVSQLTDSGINNVTVSGLDEKYRSKLQRDGFKLSHDA
jgi:hypothetical protein